MNGLDLPEIGEAGAAAATVLAPRLPVRLAVVGQDVVAGFPDRAAPPVPAGWPRLPGRVAGHGFALEIGPGLLPTAALAAFAELPQVGVSDALRQLLVELLLADLSDLVEAASGDRPEWSVAGGAIPLPHRLLVSAAAPPGDPVAVMHLSDGALAWLARRAPGLPVWTNDVTALPARGTVLLDRQPMTGVEIDGLALGDVVLLERDPAGPRGALAAVLLLPGRPGFRARLIGTSLELLDNLEATMSDPDPPAPSVDGLLLPVEFTLGTLELPLARLAGLAVGDVLDMGLDATSQVTLRVNGQPVASGELVRIAGRTGIRILDVRLARAAS